MFIIVMIEIRYGASMPVSFESSSSRTPRLTHQAIAVMASLSLSLYIYIYIYIYV